MDKIRQLINTLLGATAASDDYTPIVVGTAIAAPYTPRGIRVGSGGDFTAIRPDDVEVPFVNAADGEYFAIIVKKIKAGATAADIVAL